MATTKFEKPVGSETFQLQQQVSTMNTSLNALTTKVGNVGSTDLQTQVNTLNSNIPKIKSVYFNAPAAGQTIKINTYGIYTLFIFAVYRADSVDHAKDGYGIIKIYNYVPRFTRIVGLADYSLAYDQSTSELSITIPAYCSGTILAPVQ